MAQRVEFVVIGGGAMGSAAAWQLARRGREVVLLERFAAGHVNGASHGPSRNFNVTYDREPYLGLLVEAQRLWRELEGETDARLLDLVGMVTHGGTGEYPELEAGRAVGIPGEILSAAEASERFPGIRFETPVLWNPQGGRLNADASVAALQSAAAVHGAVVRHESPVIAIEPHGDGVTIVTESESFAASVAVVAAGAWSAKLLDGLVPLPRLRVTQEQPAHFALRVPDADAESRWPGFNHRPRPSGDEWWPTPIYGMYTPCFGVKAGWHGSGPVTDPDARSFLPEPAQLALLQRYVAEWLPGADPERLEPISCTYTTTPDHDFVLDRVGPLVVGAGFSGHGFKFTPAIGRVLADLAISGADAGPQALRLARFR
ncbi:FAD-dependent oxidoreductase [Gryllotalpicola koreensis]|uniref:N-methyl-L-tryptophan oxidase n=1 Tax=Gryllotalpicola koreensis TaxID=993086 RepID=A0ABP8A7A5_9MICO